MVLTKNLKMYYLNLDQYLIMKEQDKDSELTKLTVYDKIYGQQSFLTCSKMIPLTQKQKMVLACLNEFRLTYVQKELNAVFQKDYIQRTMIGARGGQKKKILPKELASDIEIHCSLSYGLN